jgi:hypothetical protein
MSKCSVCENLDAQLRASVKENAALRAELASLQDRLERIPTTTISTLLADAMDKAVANGANSVSMPDEYVELAGWLSNIPPCKSFLEELAEARKDAERYHKFVAISELTRDDDPDLHDKFDSLPDSPTKEDFDRLLDSIDIAATKGEGK